MKKIVRIELQPLGEVFEVQRGTELQDILFAHGVEFPCGGRGRCKGCRVKLLAGQLEINPEQQKALSSEDIAEGWRLACQCRANDNLVLEIMQWETAILADSSRFEFAPRQGLGVAVDLGTTTIVAQLIDLSTGHVLAVRSALNPQAQYGSDIMNRVDFAVNRAGQGRLERLIRDQIGNLIAELYHSMAKKAAAIGDIVLAGNTVMHHLFCGIDLEPMSHYPFKPKENGLQTFQAADLGWKGLNDTPVYFLPCVGGFVGSDILAGVLATKMHESDPLIGLIDLGTNGEIVIGNHQRISCASTAAGPAFEGAKISMGMRAATGAISKVSIAGGQLTGHVLGNVTARGICGSGLVDAVACGLDLGLIENNGRLANSEQEISVIDHVRLTQKDIRELQLAKGAIAAGIKILLKQWPAKLEEITKLYLAGAFGNYINRDSARRIGLIDMPMDKVQPAGNTALLGAKLALFTPNHQTRDFSNITGKMEHISLAADPVFQDIFAETMSFPRK
ncbi:MAG: ASKHA domain-containing protein [Planctomycetota bacterium]|jgi:uncharacterized 2Fe-2S/4Fe-4S cluster protein (DUF4445 family)